MDGDPSPQGAARRKVKHRTGQDLERTGTGPNALASSVPFECDGLEGLVRVGNVVCVDGVQWCGDFHVGIHGLGAGGAAPLLAAASVEI